ncbi:MAG: AmmeMemoRadiSam system protein B [Ignavibacteriaceae bacterium]|nr:AmmeMemoRadiSam system protein B [Ignavibacteriaceae bacterium]
MVNDCRKAYNAGLFYPEDTGKLKSMIDSFIDAGSCGIKITDVAGGVAPHAGYIYSGTTAGYFYSNLIDKKFEKVVIVSPSHYDYFKGACVYEGNCFRTPFGKIDVNVEIRDKLTYGSYHIFNGKSGHLPRHTGSAEHGIEVHLPFLQTLNKDFTLIPIVLGSQDRLTVKELTNKLIEIYDDKTIFIASSDLSHFHQKKQAHQLDSIVVENIDNYDPEILQKDLESGKCEACGGGAIVAIMAALKKLNFKNSKVVNRSDSGDINGNATSVVGYLSSIFYN